MRSRHARSRGSSAQRPPPPLLSNLDSRDLATGARPAGVWAAAGTLDLGTNLMPKSSRSMDIEEVYDQLSPAPASSTNNRRPEQPTQSAPAVVKVPYIIILDVVLRDLELPEAEYRRNVCDGNRICITVYFHTSMMYLGDENAHMAIPGVHSLDEDMSEDTAAMEAIRYMETAAKTEGG